MSYIGPSTKVFIWWYHLDRRAWLAGHEQVRNQLGELILRPHLDDDPHAAIAVRYDLAQVFKRRLDSEGYLNPAIYQAHFSLTPEGDEIATGVVASSAPDKDNRQVMTYRGLLVRPYIPRGWFVKMMDGPRELEPVKDDTIEGAADKVFERGLERFAEKAPQPAPEPELPTQKTKNYEGRLRPCAFNKRRDGYVVT
jgi:hypothetical protein